MCAVFLKFFIEVWLIYNVVLFSGIQKTKLIIYIIFTMVYYKILNIVIIVPVLCWTLLFTHCIYNSLHRLIPNS